MTDKPAKITKRYSKTTLALSDPPRRAKVDIDDAKEQQNMQVSAPIAQRIEKLYHKNPHDKVQRQSSDEKHPVILKDYQRGVSDTVTMTSKSSSKSRPYSSVGESSSEGVHIFMRNGEVLLFNDNLDAFEMHDISPDTSSLDMSLSATVKSMSLPRQGNSLRDMMKQQDNVKTDKDKVDTVSLKYEEESLSDKVHSNDITKYKSDNIQSNKYTENKLQRNNNEILNNAKHCQVEMESNKINMTQDLDTSVCDNTRDGDFKSDSDEENISSASDKQNDEELVVQNEFQSGDSKITNAKKGKYAATGPAMRKIDKYRESLRKRKKDNRSVSEPFAEQVFNDSTDQNKSFESPARTSTDKDNVTKQRRYYSKSADRPSDKKISSYAVKCTPVTRSNSLGNLANWKLANSLEDIPKGIAKSKILEIQKRVEQQDGKNITESAIWFSNPASPRVISPTNSGTSSPRYRTLSPKSSNVSTFATYKYDLPSHYKVLSPTNKTVSSLASKFDTMSSQSPWSSENKPLSPKSKQDAIHILQTTLPRSFSKIPKMDNTDKGSSGDDRSQSLIPQNTSAYNEEQRFVFPKPAPRSKNQTTSKKSKFETKANSVSTQSSTSSSVYSTQSSGEDVSENTPPPKRPARGIKRVSVDDSSNAMPKILNAESTNETDYQIKRTSKIPYTQVTPSRKQSLRMGVSSFKRKGPAPSPPKGTNIHSPPPLERQSSFSISVENSQEDSIENSSCFTFVEGKSEPLLDDKNSSSDTLPLATDNTPKINLLGVTEDCSSDYDTIHVKETAENVSPTTKEPIYADIEITGLNGETEENADPFILPAPLDFSDMSTFITNGTFPIYASVDKENKSIPQEDNSHPVPPPRLKKSSSGDIKKFSSDINGNNFKNNVPNNKTVNPANTLHSNNIGDESDDTLVHNNEHDQSSSDDSSSDILDDNYDPLYETIENMKVNQGTRVKRNVQFDLENNNDIIEYSDNINSEEDVSTTRNNNESINYPISYIQDSDSVPVSIMKASSKHKKIKDKKKNKKRSKSASPRRIAENLRTSSDEDLLEERSRKRTLSPTSVLKDTVKKMLRVRPGSPKEKSEKLLSTLEANYMNSSVSSKKSNKRSLSSGTPTSPLPKDNNGITLLSISKKTTPQMFHIDFDSHSTEHQCQHCDENNHKNEGVFDVNRYAGDSGRKAPTRASKSMGDIYESMSSINKEDLADLKLVHVDPSSLYNHQRKLPLTPRKNGAPILVKVIGKDEETGCQYSDCPFENMQAVKICHHSDCQDKNEQSPLMLCHACDKTVHDDPNFNSHLRFDIFKKGGNLNRNVSTRSLPGLSQSDDEGGGPVEDEDDNDQKESNKSKLKRKKVVVKKRYHTDEPESKSTISHVRSKSLQEHELRKNATKHKTNGMLENMSRSEMAVDISEEITKDTDKGNTSSDSVQELQDSVFSEEVVAAGQVSQNIARDQSADSLHNKSSDSMRDIDGEGDDEEYSSILNSSPVSGEGTKTGTESAFRKIDSSLDTSDSLNQTEPSNNSAMTSSLNDKSPAGRDQVDSGSVKKMSKSKIPHSRKSKDDQSKKFTMGMEYFTLKFDILDDPEVYEIVAAVKGVSLKDAVSSCLERRGINMNTVDIFLASSNTPLPLQVDSFHLGGNHLHVKAKDNEQLNRFNRSVSSTSLSNVRAPKQSMVPRPNKQVPIYLKRDQQNRASLTPHALDPPVMHHRRLSQRPKSFSHGAIKNETHPLVNHESMYDHSDESQRGKKIDDSNITVSDVSPHGTVSGTDTARMKGTGRPQTKLQSLFSPFAKSKHEALQHQLESYSQNGLPGMPSLLTLGRPEYDESVFTIENHWIEVVGINRADLTKKQGDQQESIWELLHTEVEHIKKLKVIIDLYLSCLMDLQNEALLNDVRTEDAFSNIVEVCECNEIFWNTYLKPVLEHSRKTKKLLDPSLLKEGFMKFEEIFKPYAKYCLEQKACLDYIRAKQTENELFRTFIEWAETQKQCNRLRLLDLIIMPMQRLTKYKLLLLAILKKTDKEEDRKDLFHMVEKVERFVIQVNQVMHQRAEHERLSMIIERIEAYDVIDAPNIEEVQRLSSDFCKLDLTCPVPGCGPQQRRHLLLEGGLKFREANSRLDVYCFLFTDMLLVTKPNKKADKVKVTKPPMRLDKCVVRLLKDNVGFMLVYLNEYHVASGVYTFHGESAKIWVDHVHRAQDAYKHLRKQALEKSENRMYWEMFYEENYEDDLAVMNSRHNKSDIAERQDSSSSAESFMPNIDNFPRSHSHGTLRYDPVSQDSRRLRMSNSLDENSVAQLHAPGRDTVHRSDSEPIRAQLSLPRQSVSDYHLSNEQNHHGDSPTGLSRSSIQPDVYYASSKHSGAGKTWTSSSRSDSQSSGDSQVVRSAYRTKQSHRELPERPTSISDDTEHKSKLNQRRVARNEKRYHTADAIQELRKDNRDNSIHKRLSWNLGTVDINIDDKHSYLKNKTFSSDSIKSMPSSSGVSSTGSLHLSPESEICEDDEDYEEDQDSGLSSQHHLSSGAGYPLSFDENNQSDSSTNESSATLTADYNPVHGEGQSNQQPGNISDTGSSSSGSHSTNGDISSAKSLPDISHISIKDVKEGVGSAEVKGDRKISHKQLRNMKKQLLLNSTLEASEV